MIKEIKQQKNKIMRNLTINELHQVQGGFLPAIIALVTIFTLPKIINDHRKEYNQWGESLSEYMWEKQYPYDPNNPQFPYR